MPLKDAQELLMNTLQEEELKASRVEQKAATGMGLLPIFVGLAGNLISEKWAFLSSSLIVLMLVGTFLVASLVSFYHFLLAVSPKVTNTIKGNDIKEQAQDKDEQEFLESVVGGIALIIESKQGKTSERNFDMMVGFFSVFLMLLSGFLIFIWALLEKTLTINDWVYDIYFCLSLLLLAVTLFSRYFYPQVSRKWLTHK